jgi:ethanolamine utilization protein EutA
LARNAVTGRTEITNIEPSCYSPQVFTPFADGRLDEVALASHLERWLIDVEPAQLFGGGAMITGLAAEASNAAAFARQTRRYLKDAIIAVAVDPRLESWLAFMGNCVDLSRANPRQVFVNVDIGGGTTNVAVGQKGEVSRTGSFFVGARHLQVVPGSYEIARVSPYARRLLEHLAIGKNIGDSLAEGEVDAIIDWQLSLLESMLAGLSPVGGALLIDLHTQAPLRGPFDLADAAITLSGGVGQLAYDAARGRGVPATTAFGDLGIDMARRLVERPFWRKHVNNYVPPGLGRATLFGLLRYYTQVSGATLFLSDGDMLPLNDLVILGCVSPEMPQAEVDELVRLAAATITGACLRVDADEWNHHAIRSLGEKLKRSLAKQNASQHIPLVLLMRQNLGKVLGQFVTDWGRSAVKVAVIDEIDARDAQFACIGRAQQGVVPVSFYGASATGG